MVSDHKRNFNVEGIDSQSNKCGYPIVEYSSEIELWLKVVKNIGYKKRHCKFLIIDKMDTGRGDN